MHTENYQKALDDLSFAQESMQAQLKTAGGYEGIILLQILKQLADAKAMIVSTIEASKSEDSLIHL